MPERPLSAEAYDVLFPLVWSIVREYRLGRLKEPLPWLSAAPLSDDLQLLADELESVLSRDNHLAEYTSWVLEDLPQGKAHMIDAETDAIWAFVLMASIRLGGDIAQAPILRVGLATYSRREQFNQVFAQMRGRSEQIEADLKLPTFSEQGLPRVEAAVESSLRSFHQQEVATIRAGSVSEMHVADLRAAATGEWKASPLRTLLDGVGSVRWRLRPGSFTTRFLLRATAPKIFLMESSNVVGDSPSWIGKDLGRGIARGEARVLIERFGRVPTFDARGSNAERVRIAIQGMIAAGSPPTHCLIPSFWSSYEALKSIGLGRGGAVADGGPLTGLALVEVPDLEPNILLLAHLPAAVLILQYFDQEEPQVGVHVRVDDVDPAGGGDTVLAAASDESEPTVTIDAFEYWRVRVSTRHMSRIVLSESDDERSGEQWDAGSNA